MEKKEKINTGYNRSKGTRLNLVSALPPKLVGHVMNKLIITQKYPMWTSSFRHQHQEVKNLKHPRFLLCKLNIIYHKESLRQPDSYINTHHDNGHPFPSLSAFFMTFLLTCFFFCSLYSRKRGRNISVQRVQ